MPDFNVDSENIGQITVLTIKGYLDAHTAPDFENAFKKLINEKRYSIVVSLAELQYISSAGLGVFMGFIEEVRENKGDIKLAAASPRVFKVFDLLGFPSLYEFFDTSDEACKKFSKALEG